VGKRTTAPRKPRPGEKWCPKCEAFASISDFGVDKARYDGLQGWCKACFNAYQVRRRGAKAEVRIEADKPDPGIMGEYLRVKLHLRYWESPDELAFQGPSATDALRYTCLEEGFKARPIPPGKTKREIFCKVCQGNDGECVFGGSVLSRQLGMVQTLYEAAPIRSGPGQGRTKEAAR